MKKLITISGALVAVLGVFSAMALADPGNGNGGKDKGGKNPCPPSQHGVYNASGAFVGCEHNGDGGGNCGQNQSGKGDKTGNGGDKGYGHKDDCTVEDTPTTPTDTTPTTPTTPTPPTTPTTPTPPVTPPVTTTPTTPSVTPPPVVQPKPVAKPKLVVKPKPKPKAVAKPKAKPKAVPAKKKPSSKAT